MPDLFTTYESIQPPKIVSPDVQQNYQEIQLMQQPDQTKQEDPGIDWDFMETSDQDLEQPQFIQQSSQQNKSTTAQSVVNLARQFVGGKYSWGGSSPSTGFDCSGLIKYVFNQVGINLPRTAAQQGKVGQKINLQQAQPGDVIWFGSKNSPSGEHIGLISRIDNGQIYIIDAAGKKLGITERLLPNLQIKSVRRILGQTLGNSFNQYALNFFMNKGLSEAQSRGIVGNLIQESNGNHTSINRSSGAFGLAQWLGSRKQRLFQRYGTNPTAKQQLEFIWEELNSTENKAFQKLLNTNTIAGATKAFAKHFERAGSNEMNMNKRIKYAYQT